MTKNQIKNFLQNYQSNKAIAEWKEKQSELEDITLKQFKGINDCLNILPKDLSDILIKIYFDKWSYRKLAKEMHYGKSTIERKKENGLEIMACCLKGI